MPRLLHRHPVLAAVAAVALAVAGCGGPADETVDPGDPARIRLYGTDGIMQNSFADQLSDRKLVAGMKGTRPMPRLPQPFQDRLRELRPDLQDFLFAAQAYDAVAIAAIAAELAGTPDPSVVREYIKGVTTGGQECWTVADCLELARAGVDLRYRGLSLGDGGFTDHGEPAVASYETLHFDAAGVIDPGRSEYLVSGDLSLVTAQPSPPPQPRVNLPPWEVRPLVLGGLLPETGALSGAYPPLIAAVQAALADINAAGGVFGVDVVWLDGDDGTDPRVAKRTLASHVERGVHVVIGPAASGVAEALIPDVVEAGVIMLSPTNTASHLVETDHQGYYFRTAPSDNLQAVALADMLLRDGVSRVVVVARNDAYGIGLQRHITSALLRFGMASSAVTPLTYDIPEATDGNRPGTLPGLDTLVQSIVEAQPDALVVIGYAEAGQLLERLAAAGVLGPSGVSAASG